ncbi:thiamine pyrophosphate-binding protein [Klebsiella quasipneumoniae subsp. similipneumoniae]|uniref:Thiamine pyrophosphate-binding protein n=1 Tax=Klebsiella quasipneumoniae subsp. similipneumoniae TaxID=1463164 RepID=A0AAE4MRZ7_9ENTR|nr:thiamine pyrophosphate-binding protein [Klebsiella quasipneumoniae]MDV0611944.1 thiamine pyrophosphate-binding protein [Klebsiella quasipneumoniae subsp. similipneumoniae]MDV0639687.1 thiamine pyrophosphate-binding protein [Klebsiella quasipneumoniae subsp. similipneumoniae]MDV0726758.1 thiamine pyrophosphate-binding protein [Klebsiella quasipneumoniae subsp. similipneumoniae]MDV0738329.1 thiamine pyrophosphate-binding protein [Klebsiella quasipneumoniae subsp. similipneumoniae]MDV0764677.1
MANHISKRNETGAAWILRQLKQLDASHLFMVPGKLINAFMRCYPRDVQAGSDEFPVPIVTACETGAAYMAEGYARVSSAFGVCLVIGGPGVTNTLTGIASAYTDNFPVLLLAGQIASGMEMRNVLQDSTQSGINQRDIFAPVTRAAYEVKEGQPLSLFLRESLRALKGAERGPVYLGVSKEVLTSVDAYRGEITDSVSDSWQRKPVDLIKMRSSAFETFLANNQRCIILAGLRGKTPETSRALIDFAEAYGFPVATTLSAKGLFPEDHPLALGVYGYSGHPRAIEALKDGELDGVILLGMDMTQWSTMIWSPDLQPPGGVIQVDINADYLGKFMDVTCGVVADSSAFLDALSEYYHPILAEGRNVREPWVQRLMTTSRCMPIGDESRHPASYVGLLQTHFPDNGIVSVDSGAHRSFFGHYWVSRTPDAYLSATTLGPMGWSIPAGIGASFAAPDRKCMVITGDGCMLMQGMELATAAKYQRNVLFVVFNNASYAASYFNNKENQADLTDIPDYDWCLLAKSFGIEAISVQSPQELEGVIADIMRKQTPFLIEVKCDNYHVTPNTEYNRRVKAHPLI